MVEQKPSKLMTRVRFPSPAPRLLKRTGPAQCIRRCSSVVEHSLGKGEVVRSIRTNGTNELDGGTKGITVALTINNGGTIRTAR